MPSHVKAAAPKVKGSIAFKASNQRPVASGSAGKRKRPAPPSDEAEVEGEDAEDDEEEDDDSMDEADVESEADTDDELAAAQSGKSKKTAKRKRRATSPTSFGATLVDLLGGDEETKEEGSNKSGAPQQQKSGQSTILSLAPHIRRSAQSSRLNEKASRIAIEAKKRRADRARVTDVIGGWGPPGQAPKTVDGFEKSDDVYGDRVGGGALDLEAESNEVKEWRLQGGAQGYEKRLRKVAQRGVVKLFNAIRAAQNTTESDIEQAPVAANGKGGNNKTSRKPANGNVLKSKNALGSKGRAVSELSKNNFLDLIRSGNKTAAR